MIRLATVFSGIGAIEHALDRMNIPHKIIFACDNGDVDILSKKIDADFNKIDDALNEMESAISKISPIKDEELDIKRELYTLYIKIRTEYDVIKADFKKIYDKDFIIIVNDILKIILEGNDLKNRKRKEYTILFEELGNNNNINKLLLSYKIAIKIVTDFKKDNEVSKLSLLEDVVYKSTYNINWNNVVDKLKDIVIFIEKNNIKKSIQRVKDLSEKTGMLYEKFKTESILQKLNNYKSYKEKKLFIDKIYEKKKMQNKVRQSYLANYEIDEENFHWNISFLDGNQYKHKVDLFVGGSPCQSFSLVGKQRGLNDTRGTLFYEYARLIKEIEPKVFIYENVKAILSNDNGRTWEKIKEVFDELGYKVYYKNGDKPSVLNAKDYGIPQNRERLFVVGFRKDIKLEKEFIFPQPIKLKKKMKDFLLDNVSGRYYLAKKGVDFVTNKKNLEKRYTQIDGDIQLCQKKNQQFNWHGDFVFEEENINKEKTMKELKKYFLSEKVRKYVLSTGTKNFYTKPKTDLDIARPLLTTMHKMHRAGVDNYVTTEGRLRKLTPRECLRLMGFCDSFKIVVSDTSAYQQAGNSIVVDVLINIMNSIIEAYPDLIKKSV